MSRPGGPDADPVARYALTEPDLPRRLALYRAEDSTGMSGTGIVAFGVAFGSGDLGEIVWQWRGQTSGVQQLEIFRSMPDAEYIHNHRGRGRTRIVWLDPTPMSGTGS